MNRRHQRTIEVVRKVNASGPRGFYTEYRVSCACGKFWEDVWTRRAATMAYRDHIDQAMAKPSPFEPEVTRISDEAYLAEADS